jgi:predicted RNA-binding Zn ribbon-like protein
MDFVHLSGRPCLDFIGTLRHRATTPTEQLTAPHLLSDWAVQAGLLDEAIDVTDDDLASAIELREAIFRTANARLDNRPLQPADVELLNERAFGPRLTPKLQPSGDARRGGTAARLLASLAAELVDLLAGTDMELVKRCANPGCTRLYLDASRAKNRQWCGMATCGNKAKVRAFRERQRASASGVPGAGTN